MGIASNDSLHRLPGNRSANAWCECDGNHPQGPGPFLEGSVGIAVPVSGQSSFCFLHLSCAYLLTVLPLHLSDYV